MSALKVFVTRRFPGPAVQMLKDAGYQVTVYEKDRIIPRRHLLRRIKGMHAVLSLLTDRIDDQFLRAAGPQLKIVANYAVGFDNIDVKAAHARNVVVTNSPGDLISDSVAEHTVALMFALSKRVVESDVFTRRGKYKGWSPTLFLGTMIEGKTLGLIGCGRIGVAVARRAMGMGLNIVYTDIKRSKEMA